ncbi:MAG: DoxX family protein [Bacteroidia bacterium]
MKMTTTIGRIMFAIPFLVFGMMHFMKATMMAGMIPTWLPGGVFWIYLTGIALVAFSMSILLKKMMKISGLMLAALLLMFIMLIHLPMILSGNEMAMQTAMPNMLKDVALAGAAFIISGMEPTKVE